MICCGFIRPSFLNAFRYLLSCYAERLLKISKRSRVKYAVLQGFLLGRNPRIEALGHKNDLFAKIGMQKTQQNDQFDP
jgi:hypothetical protein